jgi:hypothetical protein
MKIMLWYDLGKIKVNQEGKRSKKSPVTTNTLL